MEFSTIDTNQFHYDDPMGVTMDIIKTAEAALRGMDSNSKPGQTEQGQSAIPQGQLFYAALPSTAVLQLPPGAEGVSQPQQLYYTINLTEPQQQNVELKEQPQLVNVVVSYNEVNGIPVQLPVPIEATPQPEQPAPAPSTIVAAVVEQGPIPESQEQNSASPSRSKKKKKKDKSKKEATVTPVVNNNDKSPKKKPSKKKKGQQKSYMCRFCANEAPTKEDLISHMNTAHLDKLKFPCSHCAKRFARSDQKKRHEATIHNPENRFQDKLKFACRHCTKKFARSDQQRRHEAIHDPHRFSGEPQFACDMCDKKYHLRGSLDGHRKDNIHIWDTRGRRNPRNKNPRHNNSCCCIRI